MEVNSFVIIRKLLAAIIWWVDENGECRFIHYDPDCDHAFRAGNEKSVESAKEQIRDLLSMDDYRLDECRGDFEDLSKSSEIVI